MHIYPQAVSTAQWPGPLQQIARLQSIGGVGRHFLGVDSAGAERTLDAGGLPAACRPLARAVVRSSWWAATITTHRGVTSNTSADRTQSQGRPACLTMAANRTTLPLSNNAMAKRTLSRLSPTTLSGQPVPDAVELGPLGFAQTPRAEVRQMGVHDFAMQHVELDETMAAGTHRLHGRLAAQAPGQGETFQSQRRTRRA